MSNKYKITCIAFIVIILSGCYSTSYRTEDKQANDETITIKELAIAERQQLTVVFRHSLYKPESEYLAQAYGIKTESVKKSNSNTLDAAAAVSDFTLSYTDVWDKALSSGTLLETGLKVFGAGYVMDKLLTDRTPDIYQSGYYQLIDQSQETDPISFSNTLGDKTLAVTNDLLNNIGYFLDSTKQSELPAVDTTKPTLLKSKPTKTSPPSPTT